MGGIEKKGYISCQGESGSCAFGASRVHYFNYTAAPQPSFEEVVRRVVERDAEIGILPIQNSRSGLISEPLTVLSRSDLHIVAEHLQPITHHLMVSEAWVESATSAEVRGKLQDLTMLERKGELDASGRAELDQITRSLLSQVTAIYSDEQGLRQCDRGLKISLAGAERRLTSCTAKASRIIAHETDMAKLNKKEIPAYAAIASEECATMYKNIRLVSGINDDRANTTRYVAVSRDEPRAAQIMADIEIKALLATLTPEDLDALFEKNETLHAGFETLSTEFGFGPSSFRAGQDLTARARLLRDFLSDDKNALQALLDHLDFPNQRRIKAKLEPLAAEIRKHRRGDKESEKSHEKRIKDELRKKDYSDKVRSLFIIRAKGDDVTQASLLKALVEKAGKPRKEQIEFSVVAELPKPANSKDEGFGLVIEADGSLLGVKFGKKKETGGGFWGGGEDETQSELERVLRDFDFQPSTERSDRKGVKPIKTSIRVLGTFAKDPRRLGASAQAPAETPAKAETVKSSGWGNRREDRVAIRESAGASGMFAGFVATAMAAGALWYAWTAHLLGN